MDNHTGPGAGRDGWSMFRCKGCHSSKTIAGVLIDLFDGAGVKVWTGAGVDMMVCTKIGAYAMTGIMGR